MPACIARPISDSARSLPSTAPTAPGDDLRHVDWNVFARTEKCFLKRYRGETNTQLLMLLDTSASMAFKTAAVSKLDYARYVAASLAYLAGEQRDATGLIVFDEDVKNYVAPSTRQGQLFRLLHAIEQAEPGTHTDFAKPFAHFQKFLRRRGLVVVLSDFYEQPDTIVKTVEPLRFRGNEVILFHLLDPQEITPKFREPVLLVDMETKGTLEVSPEYAHREYRGKMNAHIEELADQGARRGSGLFSDGHQPAARRRVARISDRAAGEDVGGIPRPLVSGRRGAGGAAHLAAPAAAAHARTPTAVQLADVLRAAHAELDQAPPLAISAAVRAAHGAAGSAGAGFRAPVHSFGDGGEAGGGRWWFWRSTIRSACGKAIGWSAPSPKPTACFPDCMARIAHRRCPSARRRRCWANPAATSRPCAQRFGRSQPSDSRGSYAELARALRSIAQSAPCRSRRICFPICRSSSLPASFTDLRLADGERLVTHPLATQRLRELRGGERECAAPHLRSQESAHSGDGRWIRNPAGIAACGADAERTRGRHEDGRDSGQWPRDGGISHAGRSVWHESRRDPHRQRRRISRRRSFQFFGGARRSAAGAVRA